MRKKSAILMIASVIVAVVIAAAIWPQSKPQSSDTGIDVLVSILPQKEFVKSVAGDGISVVSIIPPGASPATYDPTPQDLIRIEEADIYFRIGHIPFESSHLDKILAINPDLVVVDTSEGVPLRYFGGLEHDDEKDGRGSELNGEHGHEEGSVDPHIWLSPKLVKTQVENIYSALADYNPDGAIKYRSNANTYLEALDELDSELSGVFSNIESDHLLVFHPSWGYFAERYGLEQIAIQQDGKDPSARQLEEIISTATNYGIKTIFVQEQFDESIAQSIAEEIGGSVISIDPLAEDYLQNLRNVANEIKDGVERDT